MAALAAAALAGGASCGGVRHPDRPDVLLVTLDTVRADDIGLYSPVSVTPNIDRLGREGLVFDRAAAPLPETRPSHTTIFTSLYPRDHGVVTNALRVDPGLLTLAAVFRAEGYATAGFTGCVLFDAQEGMSLGFEHFDPATSIDRSGADVVDAALRWIERLDSRPYFVWVHLFDGHMPYAPPAGFVPAVRDDEVDWSEFTWPAAVEVAGSQGGDLPERYLRRARSLYRGEIAYLDDTVGRLVAGLDALDHWRDTVTALTADHGECFEEGVFFDHSPCLADGALRVPLILRYPAKLAGGQRAGAWVELLDIAPTLLRLAGLAIPPEFSGHDAIVRGLSGAGLAPAFFQTPVYSRDELRQRQAVASAVRSVAGQPVASFTAADLGVGLYRDDWKYVMTTRSERLFDVGSGKEAWSERRGTPAAEMAAQLRRWITLHPLRLRGSIELTPEQVEALRALGYLQAPFEVR